MSSSRVRLVRCVAVLTAAASAVALAAPDPELAALRSRALDDPAAAIEAGRALLDGGTLGARHDAEREVLYWLGNAALRRADDAVLAEMALRLESLGNARADALALAYAGFLRAERRFQQGEADDGLAESMRAASKIQDFDAPRVRAIAALELCDDYKMAGKPRTALAYCERSTAAWRTLGDRHDLARALNLEAHARHAVGELDGAAERFAEARELFALNGDTSFAASVGDNLAQVYLDLGRAEEALALSRQALDVETRGGRIENALHSRLNVARALFALGRLDAARDEIGATIAAARAHGWNAELPELLATQASVARAQGDLALAVSAQDAIIELQRSRSDTERTTALAELEARYAARERELRIGELEQENRLRELELQTARAARAENEVALQREQSRLAISLLAAVALGLSSILMWLLWRAQRRNAAALREETLHDALTGVANRRAFLQSMRDVLESPGAPPRLDVLMIVDLDHFKQVNDRGGHLFGDQVLCEVAGCLERMLAGRALLARLGGEEFGVLGPALGAQEGLRLAEQLRTAVGKLEFVLADEDLRITISIGFAVLDGVRCHDSASWLRAADQALYSAKAHGRNRVVSAAVA